MVYLGFHSGASFGPTFSISCAAFSSAVPTNVTALSSCSAVHGSLRPTSALGLVAVAFAVR